MKYAILFFVVAIGVWLWVKNRSASMNDKAKTAARKSAENNRVMTPMVSCRVCGLHLPSEDARIGKRGTYCSEAHQLQVGD